MSLHYEFPEAGYNNKSCLPDPDKKLPQPMLRGYGQAALAKPSREET